MNTAPFSLQLQPHAEQVAEWPHAGRHILAQFDDDSIWVYQAYRPSIANYAVEHQRFGGDFSLTRMSWIKPNFLWMMFRSGWASKEGQERILAVRLKRSFFDEVLEAAVPSSFDATRFATHDQWKAAVASSDVRLQWDPDHDPQGRCLERRAVQLGLRGEMLRRYATEDLLQVEDITPFIVEQRALLVGSSAAPLLMTPIERVYPPGSQAAIVAVGLDQGVSQPLNLESASPLTPIPFALRLRSPKSIDRPQHVPDERGGSQRLSATSGSARVPSPVGDNHTPTIRFGLRSREAKGPG